MNIKLKIIIGLLVALNIFLIFNLVRLRTTLLTKNEHNSLIKLEPLEIALYDSYKTNGKKLPEINLTNLNNEIISLKNFISNKKTIILVHSEITCNSCLDSLMYGCNDLLSKSNETTQILGIAYSNSIEYLRRFARINNVKFPLLWDKNKEFIKQLSLSALPTILIINEEGRIINSFFINPSIDDLNPTFFKAASEFFNKNIFE
ncbi:MAG: redoxin domain-containing protein [Ignavibacteriaceae bacterium]